MIFMRLPCPRHHRLRLFPLFSAVFRSEVNLLIQIDVQTPRLAKDRVA